MPIGFDRIDYLIASIMAADSLIPHDNIRERLSEFGYNISRPSVTRRIRRLTSARIPSDDEQAGTQPVLYRYMTYSGLGLSNLNAYLIECDEKYVEEMCYAVGYLPYYFLYRTEKGMLLYIKSTAADIAKFNYMIRGLSEISIAAYSNRFENMGVRSSMRLYDKWDELGQKWVCTHGELDFVKRFEAI
jgi:DNA-binding Lrp family transcriptional regulator